MEQLVNDSEAGGDVVHVGGLPNARGVVYSVCVGSCNTAARVGVLDLASGEASILVEDAVGGWYVPSLGYLLFARRNGGVFAAPFSLKELRITGPELPVLEGVRMGQSYAPLQLGDDGTLVYLAGENLGTLTNEQIVWVDRNGNSTPVDGDWWGNFESIALSPDGTMLAVTDESSQRAIWVKELPDGPLTRLTPDGPNNRRPAWTPDGRYVAYQAGDTATGQVFDIRRFDASTEARRFIGLEAEGSEAPQDSVARSPHQISFSRDGRYVVYRIGGVPEGDLRYMEINGPDTVHHDLLVRAGTNEVMLVLSPDARWLAYVSDVSGTDEVYVRPFPEVMASRVKVSDGGGWEPLWSHDGAELFYRDGDGMLVAASVELEPTFRVADRDPLFLRTGGNFSTNPDEQRYDVAADGRFLMVGLRGSTAGEPQEAPAVELIMVKNWFAELREILKGQLKP